MWEALICIRFIIIGAIKCHNCFWAELDPVTLWGGVLCWKCTQTRKTMNWEKNKIKNRNM